MNSPIGYKAFQLSDHAEVERSASAMNRHDMKDAELVDIIDQDGVVTHSYSYEGQLYLVLESGLRCWGPDDSGWADKESSLWAMKAAKQLLDIVDNVRSPLYKRNLALAVTFARRAVEAEKQEVQHVDVSERA
jgi:hypothetical protein